MARKHARSQVHIGGESCGGLERTLVDGASLRPPIVLSARLSRLKEPLPLRPYIQSSNIILTLEPRKVKIFRLAMGLLQSPYPSPRPSPLVGRGGWGGVLIDFAKPVAGKANSQ